MICVKGINAVVLGGDIENIVHAFAGNVDIGKKERLRVHRAVNFKGPELAELLRVDVLRSEDFFIQRRAGSHVVILRGGDLRESRCGGDNRGGYGSPEKCHKFSSRQSDFAELRATKRLSSLDTTSAATVPNFVFPGNSPPASGKAWGRAADSTQFS